MRIQTALYLIVAVAAASLIVGPAQPANADAAQPRGATPPQVDTGYVIATNIDESDEFYAAVKRLRAHRDVHAVVHFTGRDLAPAFTELKKLRPEFVAFVMKPGDIDVNLNYDIIERASALDDDPFVDFKYGFITGKTGRDALAFVENIIRAEQSPMPRKGVDFGPTTAQTDTLADSTRDWHGNFTMRTLQHTTAGFPDAHADLLKGIGLARYWGHGMPEGVHQGLTAQQVGKMDTFPAVVFGGACYTGVTGPAFDKSLGKATCASRVIEPEKSFCLNLLASGCTGFLGALDPDHGISAGQEMQYLMESGCDLGAAMDYTYRQVALSGSPMNGTFYRLVDGNPQPPKRGEGANKYFEVMRHGAACRVLFGDPAFKPCGEAISPQALAASVDWRKLSGRIALRAGDWYTPVDLFHCDEKGWMCQKFYGIAEIPEGVQVRGVKATALKSAGRDLGTPIYSTWAIEHTQGKRLLHVQFDVPGDTFPSTIEGDDTFAEFAIDAGGHTTAAPAGNDYVVAVEHGAGADWQGVGKRLAEARGGALIEFDMADLKALIPTLRERKARFLALVMRPGTLDVNFARQLVPLLTTVDDDPFVDIAFGVITGATAKDALKLVENTLRADKQGVPERGVGLHAAGVKQCLEYPARDSLHEAPGRKFDYREHYVWGEDPHWRDWWAERRERLSGNGLIELGSCGDSQGIWLFSDQRNRDRSKHWKYDPKLVGNDPEGEMPRLTPKIIFGDKTDVFPAVVINGSCHSAVTQRTCVEGDIVSTFGDTGGKVVFHDITPDQSFPLTAIAHGATAYIGPLGANHASRASIETSYLLTMGAPLGEVMQRCYNELVMGAADRKLDLPVLVDGKPEPRDDGWVMWADTMYRVLIGDPAFNPFPKAAPDVEKLDVSSTDDALRVTMTVDDPAADPRIWDPWTKVRRDGSRLLAIVDLPQGAKAGGKAKVVSARVKREGKWENVALSVEDALELPRTAEYACTSRHPGSRADLEQQWKRNPDGKYVLERPRPEAISVTFEISLVATRPVTPAPSAPSTFDKLWEMPLKANAFGSAAVGDVDGDGKPEIVFGTYFGESRVYCVDAKTGKEKWHYEVSRGPIDDSVVIADVTGDGKPDVLFAGSASGEILCLDGAGKVQWKVDDDIAGETFDGAIAVADVTGDGEQEILIASALRATNEGILYCRKGKTGEVVWQQKLAGWIQNSVTLVDIDGDSLDDCVVGTWRGDNTVQAFSGKTGKPLWKYQAGGWMYHCPSVGDLDGDGKPELAIGGYDKCLHVINLKGEKVRVIDVGVAILAPTTMHDCDGDGKLDVIVTALDGRARVYNGKGEKLWDAHVGDGGIWRGAVVAEVDGKPGPELLIQAEEESALVALEPATGKELWRISLADRNTRDRKYWTSSAAVVADFDGDGKNDVFFTAGGDLEHRHGVAVCFKGAGVGQQWRTLHGDLRHHNRAPKPNTR